MYISFALGLIANAKETQCLLEYRVKCVFIKVFFLTKFQTAASNPTTAVCRFTMTHSKEGFFDREQ